MSQKFNDFCGMIAGWMGHHLAFSFAILSIFMWALVGPLCNYSDSWQLVANTGTTLVTFLMMFLLQNTGNRTIEEMHDRLKRLEAQNAEMLKILKND